jgi:hypothetical protein
MATLKEPVRTPVKSIKPGSPEMERFISIGYPDIATREHAQEIIKTRKENPALIPYEVAERAKAFLAAIDAKVQVIDTDPGVRNTRPK